MILKYFRNRELPRSFGVRHIHAAPDFARNKFDFSGSQRGTIYLGTAQVSHKFQAYLTIFD